MQFQAVFFDMDGTLINSEMLWKEVEMSLVSKRGFKPELNFHLSLTGAVVSDSISAMKKRYGISDAPELLAKELEEGVLDKLATVSSLPYAEEILSYLTARQIPIALVSNSSHKVIETSLSKQAWQHLIPKRFSADDVAFGKPAPDVYLYAAKSLGVEASKCLVLEDSLNGARAARAANMTCYALPHSQDPSFAQIKQENPQHFHDLAEVLNYLISLD
ncbi:MAG: HAD family phosphatase [Deinococcales bacterium]